MKPDFASSVNTLGIPSRAQPPKLEGKWDLDEAAQCILRETFNHFKVNLAVFSLSAGPEVLHQARIGWRRFKSVLRLFKPILRMKAEPPWQALKPLLACMSDMRELDVAVNDALPPLEDVYSGASAERKQAWLAMRLALAQARLIQRKAVQYAIEDPATVTSIELTSRWIEELTVKHIWGTEKGRTKTNLRHWIRRRVGRLHRELHRDFQDPENPTREHRVRILAKHLRYSIELFRPLLAKRCGSTWYQEAIQLQSTLGLGRDLIQTRIRLERLDIDQEILDFLRGVEAGQKIQLSSAIR